MNKKGLPIAGMLFVLCAIPSASVAEVAVTPNSLVVPLEIPWPELPDPIPSINYSLVYPEAKARPAVALPTQELLGMIASWIGMNFELPVNNDLPRVELVPPKKLSTLRYRGLISDRQPHSAVDDRQAGPLADGSEVYAVYDDARQTIYLPEGWQGVTPADISVLVHEMVHHLQNLGKIKYSCPQEREKLAYEGQARWLSMFGKSLDEVLGVDAFDIVVRTTCFN